MRACQCATPKFYSSPLLLALQSQCMDDPSSPQCPTRPPQHSHLSLSVLPPAVPPVAHCPACPLCTLIRMHTTLWLKGAQRSGVSSIPSDGPAPSPSPDGTSRPLGKRRTAHVGNKPGNRQPQDIASLYFQGQKSLRLASPRCWLVDSAAASNALLAEGAQLHRQLQNFRHDQNGRRLI